MQGEKDLLASKTTWGVIIPAIVEILKQFGINFEGDIQPYVEIAALATGIALIIYGRIKADKKVTTVAGLKLRKEDDIQST